MDDLKYLAETGSVPKPRDLHDFLMTSLHEPCAGLTRNAVLGPCLERSDERVLGELLGRAEVATIESSKPGAPGR